MNTSDLAVVEEHPTRAVLHIPLDVEYSHGASLSNKNPWLFPFRRKAWCGITGLLVRNGYSLHILWCEDCIQKEWQS